MTRPGHWFAEWCRYCRFFWVPGRIEAIEGFVWKSALSLLGVSMVFPQVPSLRLPFWDIPQISDKPSCCHSFPQRSCFQKMLAPLEFQALQAWTCSFCGPGLGGWQAHRLCGWSLLRVRRKVMASTCLVQRMEVGLKTSLLHFNDYYHNHHILVLHSAIMIVVYHIIYVMIY